MNNLFLMRLSDKPGELVEYNRKNRSTRRPEKIVIFQDKGRKFSFTSGGTLICWIAELDKYDATKVKNYPSCTGNPGGYPVKRLKLLWNDGNVMKHIQEFMLDSADSLQ